MGAVQLHWEPLHIPGEEEVKENKQNLLCKLTQTICFDTII